MFLQPLEISKRRLFLPVNDFTIWQYAYSIFFKEVWSITEKTAIIIFFLNSFLLTFIILVFQTCYRDMLYVYIFMHTPSTILYLFCWYFSTFFFLLWKCDIRIHINKNVTKYNEHDWNKWFFFNKELTFLLNRIYCKLAT